MPKTKISEFSATPANNTDIDSINIAEGCAPSGINDAIRELMAQLKDFQVGSAGDPVTVGGVLTVTAGTAALPAITTAGDTNTGIFFPAADTIAFTEGGAEAMRIDASGILGLGVTPSAWGRRAIQIADASSGYFVSNTRSVLGVNLYNSVTNYYIQTGYASYFEADSSSGSFKWFNAASGTAGNAITFTQAMTLDASGNLGIGTTSPRSVSGYTSLGMNNTTGVLIDSFVGGTRTSGIATTASSMTVGTITSIPLAFLTGDTERARIDSSGNLLVNATATGAYFDAKVNSYSANTYSPFAGKQGSDSAAVMVQWNAATSGNNIFTYFVTEASPTIRGSISYNRAGGLTTYNTTSDYRAKDISGPVTDSGELIDSIPVYMGTMKGATQERPMFIAHETPAYAHTGEKDAIDKDGKPVYQQMDASSLIPILWAEIQSLRVRVAQLESN
jgi:hypothetical protein